MPPEMEGKVKFETDKVIEFGFRLIEERICAAIRSRWGRGFQRLGAPHWIHRSVVKENRNHGIVSVRVKGLFQAKRWKRVIDFDCDMFAKIEVKPDGKLYFYEVEGGISPRNA